MCYVFLFASKDFACPLLRLIILGFELKSKKKKKKKEILKHIVSDGF